MRLRPWLPWLVAVFSVGCAQPASTPQRGSDACLVLTPSVRAGGFQTQAPVPAYAEGDIDHVLVQVYQLRDTQEEAVVIGGLPLALDLPRASLSVPLRFGNLHPYSTYRVRGYAFSAPGTASVHQISKDVASFVDIALSNDDRPAVGTLPIQLTDRTFVATSSVRIMVIDPDAADHVRAQLYRVVNAALVPVEGAAAMIPSGNLPATFNLGNLGPFTSYRVVITAEDAANAPIASNSVSFATAADTALATHSCTIDLRPPD